jgi:hypothetical protein
MTWLYFIFVQSEFVFVGSTLAMVPCYPALEDEGGNTYRRHELDIFV